MGLGDTLPNHIPAGRSEFTGHSLHKWTLFTFVTWDRQYQDFKNLHLKIVTNFMPFHKTEIFWTSRFSFNSKLRFNLIPSLEILRLFPKL